MRMFFLFAGGMASPWRVLPGGPRGAGRGGRESVGASVSCDRKIPRPEGIAKRTPQPPPGARPLRAVLAAQTAGPSPDSEDVARLAELEPQARALRTELAARGGEAAQEE